MAITIGILYEENNPIRIEVDISTEYVSLERAVEIRDLLNRAIQEVQEEREGNARN